MNKLNAILMFLMGTLAFVLGGISILAKAIYESRLYSFEFAMTLIQYEWSSPSRFKFSDVVDDSKELWNRV